MFWTMAAVPQPDQGGEPAGFLVEGVTLNGTAAIGGDQEWVIPRETEGREGAQIEVLAGSD